MSELSLWGTCLLWAPALGRLLGSGVGRVRASGTYKRTLSCWSKGQRQGSLPGRNASGIHCSSIELFPLPVYRRNTTIAEMSSNWITEVSPPRVSLETPIPSICRPIQATSSCILNKYSAPYWANPKTHTGGSWLGVRWPLAFWDNYKHSICGLLAAS